MVKRDDAIQDVTQAAGLGERLLPFKDTDRLTEVNKTLDRIESGGSFLYKTDGTVFHNREGKLPAKPDGYYKKYTVNTPGAPNRGTRRIVQGQNEETYYTDDHYQTFIGIDPRRH